MSTEIFVQDVTLRDGMHAVRHRITPEDVKAVANKYFNDNRRTIVTLAPGGEK